MRFFHFAIAIFLAASSAVIAQSAIGDGIQNSALVGLLPAAQEGWTRDTESEQILDWVRAEGNNAASAAYSNGSRRFIITFHSDPNEVASIQSIVNNPDMVQYYNGKKENIGGHEFLFVNTQYFAVLENSISIESSVSADEIVAMHLETIDFEALSRVGE